MADAGVQAGPQTISGSAVPFRFEFTWRSLTRSLEPTRPSSLIKSANLPARSLPARQVSSHDIEAREWEMVLPRTRRPETRPSFVASPPEISAAPNVAVSPPGFAVAPEPATGRWIALGGTLVIAVAVMGVYWTGWGARKSSESVAATEMGGAGWITEWASDQTGSARARQLSLYRPSMSMSDYRLEFSGQIERRSLGWVFRAANTRNYYVGKLERASASSPLTVTRFAVINGAEGPHFQRVMAAITGPLKVRQEARGPKFTIYVQNQIVEDWHDDRLKTGGMGFLNEREERGQVGSIQISFLRGGVGQ